MYIFLKNVQMYNSAGKGRMEYICGIDIGTAGCKTVLLDQSGAVVSGHSREYFTRTSDAMTDMDPMDWWKAVVETLKTACETAGIQPSQISAVGCSGQMQGCTFIGQDGRPVRNSMLWFDMSCKEETAWLTSEYGEIFRRNCTIPPTTALTVSKIRWTMAHEPESWVKTKKILFASGFITYMLTGCISADRSNIGLSGLNNVDNNSWAGEILNIAGIEVSKLPDLFDCEEVVGKVTREAAQQTGLREGIPVIAGCGDATGECYSVNIENRQELKLRLGSAAAANAVVPREWLRNGKVSRGLPYNKSSCSIGGYTKACAFSVKWVRDVFFSELPKEDASYDLMDKEAENKPLGSGGILFHPYLNGENAPYFNTELRAKFTGIRGTARRGDFLHAVYEGTAFSIMDMIESVPALTEMRTLILCGGGVKSRVWLQVIVDVLGRNGVVPKSADASFGVALMAGQAIGMFNAGKAADRSRAEGSEVTFNPEKHHAYTDHFKRYREIAQI